jgi:hypothetical protein
VPIPRWCGRNLPERLDALGEAERDVAHDEALRVGEKIVEILPGGCDVVFRAPVHAWNASSCGEIVDRCFDLAHRLSLSEEPVGLATRRLLGPSLAARGALEGRDVPEEVKRAVA